MSTPCHFGAPRWMKPTKAEREASKVPEEDRTRFRLIGRHTKHTGDPGPLIGAIREGDLVALRMSKRQKKDGLLRGNKRTVLYYLTKYAHLAVVVRDPEGSGRLRLFSSEALRGPNVQDELGDLRDHSFDLYRLDKVERLDFNRLSEFAAISIKKSNKWLGYNFLGMLGLWSNHIEPQKPSDIGDDYICSTSVAAALHYAGLDLDQVRCCEAFNLISPWRVVRGEGRFYNPVETEICKP